MISGQGYYSVFEMLPWYGNQSLHILLLEIRLMIILSQNILALVISPLRWMTHKLGKKEDEKADTKIAFIAWIWGAFASSMPAMFVFRALGVLYAIDAIAGMPNFV